MPIIICKKHLVTLYNDIISNMTGIITFRDVCLAPAVPP